MDYSNSSSDDDVYAKNPIRDTGSTVRGTSADEFTGMGYAGNRGMESNTKLYGIGASLAMKMGYQPGKGLGKNLQGISAPIETIPKRGRTGIGSTQPKTRKTAIPSMDNLRIDKSTPKSAGKLMLRKGTKKDKEVKTETVIQPVRIDDIDEVLDLNHRSIYMRPDRSSAISANTKVIDMTGPQTKVHNGYDAIFGQRLSTDVKLSGVKNLSESECSFHEESSFSAPELIHNINRLIGNCEEDIAKSSRKSKWSSQQEGMIKNKLERLVKKVQQGNSQIQSTQSLINPATTT